MCKSHGHLPACRPRLLSDSFLDNSAREIVLWKLAAAAYLHRSCTPQLVAGVLGLAGGAWLSQLISRGWSSSLPRTSSGSSPCVSLVPVATEAPATISISYRQPLLQYETFHVGFPLASTEPARNSQSSFDTIGINLSLTLSLPYLNLCLLYLVQARIGQSVLSMCTQNVLPFIE